MTELPTVCRRCGRDIAWQCRGLCRWCYYSPFREEFALPIVTARGAKSRRSAAFEETTYTDDEAEFLKAIDEYKRSNRRPFPTWKEVLEVLRSLGYEKASKA